MRARNRRLVAIVALLCLSLTGCERKQEVSPRELIEGEVDAQFAVRMKQRSEASATDPAISEVTVLLEYVAVPESLVSDFLAVPLSGDASESFRRTVQVWLKTGEAKPIETMVAKAKIGSQAKSESGSEIYYSIPVPTLKEPVELEPDAEKQQGGDEGVASGKESSTIAASSHTEVYEAANRLEILPRALNDGVLSIEIFSKLSLPLPLEGHEFYRIENSTTIELMNATYEFIGSGKLPAQLQSESVGDSLYLLFVRADFR